MPGGIAGPERSHELPKVANWVFREAAVRSSGSFPGVHSAKGEQIDSELRSQLDERPVLHQFQPGDCLPQNHGPDHVVSRQCQNRR